MKGGASDRGRFALVSTDRAFPATETADTPQSTKGMICRISNEITVSYVLTDRTKKRD